MKKFVKTLILSIVAAAFLLSPEMSRSCIAQEASDKSDATPEITRPKEYSEKEISEMEVEKLKELSDAGSAIRKSPLVIYCLGQKYRKDRDAVKSVKFFRQVLEEFPKHYLAPKSCLEIALTYKESRDVSAEINILKTLSESYPGYSENITGLYRLAEIFREQKKIDDMHKALDTLEASFAGRAEAIPGLFFSANEYLKNYNSKKAIEKFDKLLSIKEITAYQKSQALTGKATAFEYAGNAAEAGKIYDEIAKMEIDQKVIEMAKKSKENLAKAPKEPLVKFEEPRSETLEVKAQTPQTPPAGRVRENVSSGSNEIRIKD